MRRKVNQRKKTDMLVLKNITKIIMARRGIPEEKEHLKTKTGKVHFTTEIPDNRRSIKTESLKKTGDPAVLNKIGTQGMTVIIPRKVGTRIHLIELGIPERNPRPDPTQDMKGMTGGEIRTGELGVVVVTIVIQIGITKGDHHRDVENILQPVTQMYKIEKWIGINISLREVIKLMVKWVIGIDREQERRNMIHQTRNPRKHTDLRGDNLEKYGDKVHQTGELMEDRGKSQTGPVDQREKIPLIAVSPVSLTRRR